jgi:uncharacterized protein
MKPMVFVDTAAWLAFIGKSDPMQKKALALLNEVLDKKTLLVLTDYIVLENANSLCRRGAMPELTLQTILNFKKDIDHIAARWGAHHLRLFGSIARCAQKSSSDVDIIGRFDKGRSLFDLGGLKADLEDLLGCPVDVLSEGGLHAQYRDEILKETIAI